MAVERTYDLPEGYQEELPMEVPAESRVEESEDGGVLVTFGPQEPTPESISMESLPHLANLAEVLPEEVLDTIGHDLVDKVKSDISSRDDWVRTYRNGLKLLGFKEEKANLPFEGAASAVHPLLAEAVVDHQSQMIVELVPPDGPVKVMTVGHKSEEKEAQAQRVMEFMNYLVLDKMEEFFDEHDCMLFQNALNGSAFKKVFFSAEKGRPVSMFVPAEDFVVDYATTNLGSSERYTHVSRYSEDGLRKQQLLGLYRDIPMEPTMDMEEDTGSIKDEEDRIHGLKRSYNDDGRFVVYEVHCYLDLPFFEHMDEMGMPTGMALPYVITVEPESGIVLSIYRNWAEGDELYRKLEWFIHYPFIRGPGFYGLGLLHLIGGLSHTATTALRELLDAGTLANLKAGFKNKGVKIVGDPNKPLQPGEFRDVEALGQDLSKALVPMDFGEPSQTLLSLLQYVVTSGQRFADTPKELVSNSANYGPLGTTLALVEAAQKPHNAIFRRLHNAQKQEFRILARICRDYLPDEYPYEVGDGNRMVKAQDFDDRVDVLPASDPRISNSAQRVAQTRMVFEAAQAAPDMHNRREVLLRGYKAVGIAEPEKLLVPPPQEVPPLDPVSEHMALLTGRPVKAYPEQNHQAHIETHVAFLEDPRYGGNDRVKEEIGSKLEAHIAEHMAFRYRNEIEQAVGQQLPPPGQQMPPEVAMMISAAVAKAAQQLAQNSRQGGGDGYMDPMVQNELMQTALDADKIEIDRRQKEEDRKLKEDLAREDDEFDRRRHEDKMRVEEERLMIDREKNEIARERAEAARQSARNRGDGK